MPSGLRNLCLLFTGQGSQRVGMTSTLERNWPQLMRYIYEEANDTLRLNLHKIMTEGPSEDLTQTSIAQPAIILHSYAITKILERELGFKISGKSCDYVIGHSVGEYSALVAANALSFAQAVLLVHQRGLAIEEGIRKYNQPTSMAALLPISSKDALEVVEHSQQVTNQVCEVANYNSKRQIVLSGHKQAIEEAILYAKKHKKVKKAVQLQVSAPFHCSILDETGVSETFARHLDANQFLNLEIPIISNVTAQDTKSGDEIRELLKKQISAPVRWTDCIDFFIQKSKQKNIKRGVPDAEPAMNAIECGYGGVLSGLVRQHANQDDRIAVTSLGTSDEITNFIKEQNQKEYLFESSY